jgi:spore coat polysaccharide biosynthesis protein SpsF (cytidylyltransferase family)
VTVAARSEHPELFLMRSVPDIQDNSDLRWTVDTAQDLEVARLIYQRLGLDTAPRPYREILAQVRGDPALMARDTGGQTWDPTHQPI